MGSATGLPATQIWKGAKPHKIVQTVLSLLLLWNLAAWFAANWHVQSRVVDLAQLESERAQARASDLAESVQRNLHYLGGIPDLLTGLVRVKQAVSRFGPSNKATAMPYAVKKLRWTKDAGFKELSQYLQLVKTSLNADLIFVVNGVGDCIAASNWNAAASLIGSNVADREYFMASRAGRRGRQYAIGKTTSVPGLFFSSPILIAGHFMGAVVAKTDISNLSFLFKQTNGYVTDRYGVIILAQERAREMSALPGSPALAMSERERIALYQKNAFSPLAMEPWTEGSVRGLWRVKGEDTPHVIASSELPEYGLTVHVEGELPSLHTFQRERLEFLLLLAVLGSTAILSGAGAWFYLRSVGLVKAQLTAQKEQLDDAQRIAHTGSWILDIVSEKLVWSDEIYRIFGQDPQSFQATYTAFLEAIHPDDREAVSRAVKQSLENRASYAIAHRVVRPDGSVRFVQERGELEMDGKGAPWRMVGTVQDVTDQKQFAAMLDESAQHTQAILDNVIDGIISIDKDGVISSFNQAAERIFGYSSREMIGRNVSMLMPRPYRDSHDHYLRRYLDTGLAHIIGIGREVEGQRHDGSLFPLDLAVSEIRQNGVPMFIGVVRDITERKRVEAELRAAKEAAERASQAKSEFLSSMSHELRTPMNAILGFAQLLQYEKLSAEQQDSVAEILKAGRHLLALINEVLDLSKVESGHIELSLEPVDLAGLLRDCQSMIQPLATARGVAYEHENAKGRAVRADRMRLKQVLLNLLANAIKYNRDGGSVRLTVQPGDEGYWRLAIADTGRGIPAERMPELFQPFNRLGAEHGATEGTGIGLTITKKLIEMMGGSIGVDSRVGVGSTFWIELPQAVPQKTAVPVAVTEHLSAATAVRQTHSVLYIEDNPVNLKLVSQILGRRPHVHLITAHTAELGMELARMQRPELVLLDINMPGVDGNRVLERFKADAMLHDVPVLAVTANAQPHDIERGIAAGFAEYLTKPLEVEHFLQTVDRYLMKEGI